MKDSGELTASLGVSNFRPQDFEALLPVAKYKPVVNQLEYHPFVLTHLDPILKIQQVRIRLGARWGWAELFADLPSLSSLQPSASQEHGILTEAYGPLSPLIRHSTGGGPLKPILNRIAHRVSSVTGRDVDAAAVLLLWTRAKGVIAVTASGNEERIHKLAAVQTLPDLTEEEVQEIEEVGRKIYFRAYVSVFGLTRSLAVEHPHAFLVIAADPVGPFLQPEHMVVDYDPPMEGVETQK